MNLLKKYKHTWIIPVYGIFYLTAFQYLEQRDVRPHIIHMKIDDYIPFCEYFIVPYLLWFAYIAVTVLYFSLFNDSKREFYQLIFTLGVGMTLFLVISYIYPNGQDLRPKLTGDSIFIELVRHLYRIDTPTNILPSIHVFNSVACCTAVFKNAKARKHPVLLGGTPASDHTYHHGYRIPEAAYTCGCGGGICAECLLLPDVLQRTSRHDRNSLLL